MLDDWFSLAQEEVSSLTFVRFKCAELLFQPKTYEPQTKITLLLAPDASVAREGRSNKFHQPDGCET